MTITIQEITDRERWNGFLVAPRFIEGGQRGHLLQSYEWGELSQYLGARIYRLGALENGRMAGAMQLIVSSVPMPVSVPRLHFDWLYCARGPTVEQPGSSALTALIEHTHAIARKEHAVVLRLEPNIANDDPEKACHPERSEGSGSPDEEILRCAQDDSMENWITAYRALGFQINPFSVHERRSWVLDIRPDAEQLLANFKMTWRQNVRIAERKGVIVREAGNDADFDAYYNLLKITSERDAFFIHSKDYHKEVLRQFAAKGDAVLYLAEHEGEALAAKMLIRFGDWCWDMFGASSNNKRNLKATYLLQYRCLQWAKAQGCSYFDFRAIPEILEPGEAMWGVYEYKKGFGGFSRLHMPTQDYVYRPLVYTAWRKLVEVRRARHYAERKKVELERAARGSGTVV
jgi:peptidoglycan pentaglycine glycine transferase (the first glycine)